MANTRSFYSVINAVAGFTLPTGAAAGKIFTSDSEGKASWADRAKVISADEHPWTWVGEVPNEEKSLPGFFVKVGTNNVKNLIAIEYWVEEGTEVEFELRRKKGEAASEALTGFTALKAKSNEIKLTEPTAIEVASKDFIYLKLKKASGNPKNFSATGFVERIIS